MANTFVTVQEIAREALLRLRENQVMARRVYRAYDPTFRGKRGDTIQIQVPNTFTADEFSGTTTNQDIARTAKTITLDKIADVSTSFSSKERAMNMNDLSEMVINPAMEAIAQKIDTDLTALYSKVPYFYGTAGTTPSSISDIANVRKVLQSNKVPNSMRSLVMDVDAEAKFLTVDSFVEADKAGTTAALREASLGRLMGFENFASQNIQVHTAGAYTALSDVDATAAAGATSIVLSSAAGSSTAALLEGDIFETDDGQQFVVTADSAAAVSGDVTVAVYPAVGAALSAEAVTFAESHTSNLAFHKNAFALTMAQLEVPMGGAEGYVASFEDLSVRVTMDYNMSTKKEEISFDCLYSVDAIDPRLAARLLG